MMKREDEIFQKLKKERPLIKTTPSKDREQTQRASIPINRVNLGVSVKEEAASRHIGAAAEKLGNAQRQPVLQTPVKRQLSPSAQPPSVSHAPRQAHIKTPTIEAPKTYLAPFSLKKPELFQKPQKLSVDERNRGALIYRHELKFYLNYCDYMVLRQQMRALLQPDRHADVNGEYYIRSLYFDDMYNTALQDKLAGVQGRYKYRIRIYNFDKSVIRFEKKIKDAKFIAKDSFRLSYAEYRAFMEGDIEFLLHKAAPLAKEVYFAIRQKRLSPRVVVDYQREPFVMDYETVRITFDKNLRAGEPGDIFDKTLPVMPILDRGIVILEVKFNRTLPAHLNAIINDVAALQGSAISKYILCRQYD